MSIIKLPSCGRPEGIHYRKCSLGVDLPSSFVYDLRGVDENLYPIFHPYRILWDDMVNAYVGKLEDPRYSILENSSKAGELIMGHILTNGKDEPTLDGSWHVWRWCEPARAWAHIINIDCKDPFYLRLLVERLYLQARYNDKYGHRGYQRMMEEADLAKRAKIQDERQDLMKEISKVNSAMMNRVMDNFSRGVVAATKPKKEIITSYAGQGKRSKIVRDLTDREGGLILPDGYGDEH